ncbi:peptidase P60 [Thermoflavimicrobium daqui]|uniref:Peptidase P60 n=2 Tax=Thermoflavimicrobium daqui TaxID=2137476 RepID=A0A364K1L0_9BACL|nr:C40 family peptidase [Thermoflavimicrobium daqui]RAL21907.1 peptidase P60 [Thermoflavimicrobium daqui]
MSLAETPQASEKETAYIDVAAATVWTEPNIARPIDEPSTTNPVDLWKWTRSMNLDDKLWLVGNLETQALLGNKVTIDERKGDWVKVVVHGQPTPRDSRGYPGWMPARQLTYNKQFALKEKGPFVLVTQTTANLYKKPNFKDTWMEISYNTRLPLVAVTSKAYSVLLPNGKIGWIKKGDGKEYRSVKDIPKPKGEDLVKTAKKFLNLPYLWAGTSGFGFDCSGFTFTVHQSHGITIPRDSGPQSQSGKPVDPKDLKPGDLLFYAYNNGKGRVHHVSMYIGNGMMIHSPNSAKTVEIIPVDTPGYKEEFAGARRYVD